MTAQTQEQFFQAHADADGNLTDAQTMEMMFLPVEADTPAPVASAPAAEDSSATAAPAASVAATDTTAKVTEEPAPAPATPAAAPTPTVLAKDGVHTIPFSELERSRTAEQALAQQLAAAQAQLAALQAAAPAAAPAAPAAAAATPAAPSAQAEFDVDLGDFSEGAIKDGIKKAVADGVAAQTAALNQQIQTLQAQLAPIQAQQVQTVEDEHFGSIRAAHPDVESVVPSAEFAKWRDAQPAFARAGIVQVIDSGTAAEVIEVLNTYKAAAGVKPVPTPTSAAGALPTPQVDAATAAAAAEAIAKAKSPVPSSLSEIPAGNAQPADPLEAMAQMSDSAQMNVFMGKTPEQIEAIVSKLL